MNRCIDDRDVSVGDELFASVVVVVVTITFNCCRTNSNICLSTVVVVVVYAAVQHSNKPCQLPGNSAICQADSRAIPAICELLRAVAMVTAAVVAVSCNYHIGNNLCV